MRSLTRRSHPQRRNRRTGEDHESYSDGSNAVTTPASADTPLASSISRGTSMNIIRDPYSSTPVRYKVAAAAAAAASADQRRHQLTSSKSLSQQQQRGCSSPLLAGGGDDDGELDNGKRSHSADSVFTILIRLPAVDTPTSDRGGSSDKPEHKASIRMIPIPSASVQRGRIGSAPTGGNPPAVRSRSVPVGGHDSSTTPYPPHRPIGSGHQYTSNRSLAARPAQYNESTGSLLCGTNLHLSLSRLTKPNHLPLNHAKLKKHQQHASPWVPRSCMPVAQSPLIVRCTRFNGETGSAGGTTPVSTTMAGGAAKRTANLNATNSTSTGALQTVSASVAGAAGNATGIRRANQQPYSPSAAAAAAAAAAATKKAAKKPKKKNQEKRQERKAAKTLSAILLAFIITWTPYNVLTLLKAVAPCSSEDCFSEALWNFSYYLCYINSTINPVCYALCNASFRHTYVRILTCKWHTRTKTGVQRGVYN